MLFVTYEHALSWRCGSVGKFIRILLYVELNKKKVCIFQCARKAKINILNGLRAHRIEIFFTRHTAIDWQFAELHRSNQRSPICAKLLLFFVNLHFAVTVNSCSCQKNLFNIQIKKKKKVWNFLNFCNLCLCSSFLRKKNSVMENNRNIPNSNSSLARASGNQSIQHSRLKRFVKQRKQPKSGA